jgi:transcriptional regulator with XRE-family HTH domain
MIGVSVRTLQNWEQGRREPEGPAKALLRIALRNPSAVLDALHTKWTESIAVGSELFVNEAKELLGAEGRGRKVREREGVFELREDTIPYSGILEHENVALGPTNCHSWSDF